MWRLKCRTWRSQRLVRVQILASNAKLRFQVFRQKFLELVRAGDVGAALDVATTALLPLTEENVRAMDVAYLLATPDVCVVRASSASLHCFLT